MVSFGRSIPPEFLRSFLNMFYFPTFFQLLASIDNCDFLLFYTSGPYENCHLLHGDVVLEVGELTNILAGKCSNVVGGWVGVGSTLLVSLTVKYLFFDDLLNRTT